jgi:hypothetical protein
MTKGLVTLVHEGDDPVEYKITKERLLGCVEKGSWLYSKLSSKKDPLRIKVDKKISKRHFNGVMNVIKQVDKKKNSALSKLLVDIDFREMPDLSQGIRQLGFIELKEVIDEAIETWKTDNMVVKNTGRFLSFNEETSILSIETSYLLVFKKTPSDRYQRAWTQKIKDTFKGAHGITTQGNVCVTYRQRNFGSQIHYFSRNRIQDLELITREWEFEMIEMINATNLYPFGTPNFYERILAIDIGCNLSRFCDDKMQLGVESGNAIGLLSILRDTFPSNSVMLMKFEFALVDALLEYFEADECVLGILLFAFIMDIKGYFSSNNVVDRLSITRMITYFISKKFNLKYLTSDKIYNILMKIIPSGIYSNIAHQYSEYIPKSERILPSDFSPENRFSMKLKRQ